MCDAGLSVLHINTQEELQMNTETVSSAAVQPRPGLAMSDRVTVRLLLAYGIFISVGFFLFYWWCS